MKQINKMLIIKIFKVETEDKLVYISNSNFSQVIKPFGSKQG
jgi:hypothetical protein